MYKKLWFYSELKFIPFVHTLMMTNDNAATFQSSHLLSGTLE